jgi:hypothetical protein
VMANSAQKVALTCIGKLNHAIPVSNGIIEHREKIGSAVWLFLLLIDWTTSEDENGIGKVLGGKPIKLKDLTEALHLKSDRSVHSFSGLDLADIFDSDAPLMGTRSKYSSLRSSSTETAKEAPNTTVQTSNKLQIQTSTKLLITR